MRFYIDCEFNSFQGDLISMAIVCEKGELYLVNADFFKNKPKVHPWVEENVLPYVTMRGVGIDIPKSQWKGRISHFFYNIVGEEEITIVADWWTDIEHFCNVIIGDNGSTVTLNKSRKYNIIVDRTIDAYDPYYGEPLPGSIQHNALWDARNIMRVAEKRLNEKRLGAA